MQSTHPLGNAPIGQQLLTHFAHRDAVRHATPLFPSSWAEFLSPLGKTTARSQPQRKAGNQGNADGAVCNAG